MEMKSIAIDKSVEKVLKERTPAYLIKKRDGGGGKKLDYISGGVVTDMLNRAFGYAWSWEVKREWISQAQPFFNKYDKNGKDTYKGNKGSWEEQESIVHVLGTLTVYMSTNNQIIKISKDGYGSKVILGKSADQQYEFKSAGTDALKKAASLFGIGLDLYRDENEQAYFDEISYEDPWTDEAKAKYANELDLLYNYQTNSGYNDEDFAELIMSVLGTYVVSPDNIEYLINTLYPNRTEGEE